MVLKRDKEWDEAWIEREKKSGFEADRPMTLFAAGEKISSRSTRRPTYSLTPPSFR